MSAAWARHGFPVCQRGSLRSHGKGSLPVRPHIPSHLTDSHTHQSLEHNPSTGTSFHFHFNHSRWLDLFKPICLQWNIFSCNAWHAETAPSVDLRKNHRIYRDILGCCLISICLFIRPLIYIDSTIHQFGIITLTDPFSLGCQWRITNMDFVKKTLWYTYVYLIVESEQELTS